MFRPEILAPAGNLFKLKTAVRYGADAVYVAGRQFGLRSAADNFTVAELVEGCQFAHAAGVRVYVVLNAFLFDEELAQLPPFLKAMEQAGVDAVIVSDLGVVETVRTHCAIPIHLSTQSSALNVPAARLWKQMGVTRIVLGREVTIEEAGHIKREAGVEVELFVHGAMCMAFSGNCTISNYTAGRDSNRGGCVQSCRFAYTLSAERGGSGPTGHFFSSKDLQGISLLEQFAAQEIDSLKIEGRMKSALYVATATRAYRAARDAALGLGSTVDAAYLLNELDSMSHRDYTEGNLRARAGSDSVYDHGSEGSQSYEMAGHVVAVDPGRSMMVSLKNPVVAGTTLILLTPQGGIEPIDTALMKSLTGASLAKGTPNRVVVLPYHPAAEPDLLLRKPKHAETHCHAATG